MKKATKKKDNETQTYTYHIHHTAHKIPELGWNTENKNRIQILYENCTYINRQTIVSAYLFCWAVIVVHLLIGLAYLTPKR